MRVKILLFIGLSSLLLRGSILLPEASVAQASPIVPTFYNEIFNQENQLLPPLACTPKPWRRCVPRSPAQTRSASEDAGRSGITNKSILRALMTRPQKRDPQATLKAIQAVKRRKSALMAQAQQRELAPSKDTALLPVVNQDDILLKHRELANEVLRSLPWGCQGTLKTFYVRYDNPARRGLAGKTSIILDGSVPDDEFKALLIHEFGHITDLGCKIGNPSAQPSSFKDGAEIIYQNDPSVGFYSISWSDSKTKRSGTKSRDFVSGYAAWDPFEDFAETYAYFVLQNDAFKERAKTNTALATKYRWMATNIFRGHPLIAKGEHVWTGEVPWDSTKLGFEWKPEMEVAVR